MLYHSPISGDRLRMGKFCSIACGAKFLFNSANHALHSLSTYPSPLFYEAWEHGLSPREAWDNKGDIAIGSDVWIGYEAVILAGVTIGDGSVIGTRAVVTRNVPPYTIVGGTPARRSAALSAERFDALPEMKWWDWPAGRFPPPFL